MSNQLEQASVAANLVRFRNRRQWSKKRAAEESGVAYRTYLKLEKGETNFQLDTLRKVAAALEVKLSDLLRPAPRLGSARFRAAEGLRKRDDILAQVGIWLQAYNELEDMLDMDKSAEFVEWLDSWERPDESLSERRRGEEAARAVRDQFELADEPIRDMCGLLDSNGIKVLPYETSTDAFFGLSVGHEDGGPAVVVNVYDRISVERWIFSAAHELGHIVLHRDSFDAEDAPEDETEEQEANWFASEFVMPDALFRQEWEETSGLGFVHRVFKLKRMFRVSYQTVLRRLAENRKADGQRDAYRALYDLWEYSYERHFGRTIESKKFEPEPLDPSAFSEALRAKEPEMLAGSDFVEEGMRQLVREAYDREMITVSKVAEYLQLSLAEARELAGEWQQERGLGL